MLSGNRKFILCFVAWLMISCFHQPAGRFRNLVNLPRSSLTSPGNWYTIHYLEGNTSIPIKDSLFRSGAFVQVEEGLKVYASSYRLGGWLVRNEKMFLPGKEVYMKWKVDAGFDFADIHAVLYPTTVIKPESYKSYISISYLSTRNQWDESVKIPFSQEWYYTRIVFNNDSFTSFTAKDNYDNRAGTVIQKFSKPLTATEGYIGMSFNDVYGGAAAWFVIGELVISRK